jgi:hypothetical protein
MRDRTDRARSRRGRWPWAVPCCMRRPAQDGRPYHQRARDRGSSAAHWRRTWYFSLSFRIQERLQLTIVFITHDLRVAARVCDRVIVMQYGKVVEGVDSQISFCIRNTNTRVRCCKPFQDRAFSVRQAPALHAPESSGARQRDSVARSARRLAEFWRHFGDGGS